MPVAALAVVVIAAAVEAVALAVTAAAPGAVEDFADAATSPLAARLDTKMPQAAVKPVLSSGNSVGMLVHKAGRSILPQQFAVSPRRRK